MQAFDWLQQYEFARHALIAGVAVGTVCSLLSVVVVLKRMAFIGEGVSHAGFGGVGTALILGLGGMSQDAVVMMFCVMTGVLIGVLSRKRHVEPDSAIGILLVLAMALGVLLTDVWRNVRSEPWYVERFGVPSNPPSFEQLLFGSLLTISPTHMWLAVGLSAAIVLTLVLFYKEILFFTFAEPVSAVFGVRTGPIYYLLLVLLSLTIVLSMKLAGFLLVSALLVIPGATALLWSRKMSVVLIVSWCVGMAGVVGGLLLSLEVGHLSSGPCIVAVLGTIFGLTLAVRGR